MNTRGTTAPRRTCLILVGLLLSCRTPSGSTEPSSDPPDTEPTTSASTPPNERYLAEERWNAQTSDTPTNAETTSAEDPAERYGRPSEEEFKAWDRKDPAGEAHLRQWDKDNFNRLQSAFHDLECLRARMAAAGEASVGAKPGSAKAKAWVQAKRTLITQIDQWQKDLFAMEPRIFEKSKAIGMFLEAHELVMHELPRAYNNDDPVAVKKTAAHWMIVEAKFDKYTKTLGHTPTRASAAHCKAMAKP